MKSFLIALLFLSFTSAHAGFKEWFGRKPKSNDYVKKTEDRACDLYEQIRKSSQSYDVSAFVSEFESEAIKITKGGKKLRCAPNKSELVSMLASGYKKEACYEKLVHEKYKWGEPKGLLGKRFLELSLKYKEVTQQELTCTFSGKDMADFDSHKDALDLCRLVREFEGVNRIYHTSGQIWIMRYLMKKAAKAKQNPSCNIAATHIEEITLKKIGEENCRILEEAKSGSADQFRIHEYEKLQSYAADIPGRTPACFLPKDETQKLKIDVLTKSICSLVKDLKSSKPLYGTTMLLARMDLREIRSAGGASVTCDGQDVGAFLEQSEKEKQPNSGL